MLRTLASLTVAAGLLAPLAPHYPNVPAQDDLDEVAAPAPPLTSDPAPMAHAAPAAPTAHAAPAAPTPATAAVAPTAPAAPVASHATGTLQRVRPAAASPAKRKKLRVLPSSLGLAEGDGQGIVPQRRGKSGGQASQKVVSTSSGDGCSVSCTVESEDGDVHWVVKVGTGSGDGQEFVVSGDGAVEDLLGEVDLEGLPRRVVEALGRVRILGDGGDSHVIVLPEGKHELHSHGQPAPEDPPHEGHANGHTLRVNIGKIAGSDGEKWKGFVNLDSLEDLADVDWDAFELDGLEDFEFDFGEFEDMDFGEFDVNAIAELDLPDVQVFGLEDLGECTELLHEHLGVLGDEVGEALAGVGVQINGVPHTIAEALESIHLEGLDGEVRESVEKALAEVHELHLGGALPFALQSGDGEDSVFWVGDEEPGDAPLVFKTRGKREKSAQRRLERSLERKEQALERKRAKLERRLERAHGRDAEVGEIHAIHEALAEAQQRLEQERGAMREHLNQVEAARSESRRLRDQAQAELDRATALRDRRQAEQERQRAAKGQSNSQTDAIVRELHELIQEMRSELSGLHDEVEDLRKELSRLEPK